MNKNISILIKMAFNKIGPKRPGGLISRLWFLIFFLISISFALSANPISQVGSVSDKGRWAVDQQYRVKAYLPAGWERDLKKGNNRLRVILFHPEDTYIVAELFDDVQYDEMAFRDYLLRHEKSKQPSLRLVSQREFKVDHGHKFLMVMSFQRNQKTYLQRITGFHFGKRAYYIRYVAPEIEYYQYTGVSEHFMSTLLVDHRCRASSCLPSEPTEPVGE